MIVRDSELVRPHTGPRSRRYRSGAVRFGSSKLLDLFAFLRYRAGLGALLLMNGALAFGTAGNLGLITGGVTMGCGLVGVVSNFVRGGSTTNEPLLPS